MKKQAECDDSNLAPELPIAAIRGMCSGISADVPNDAEHIEVIERADRTGDRSGSRSEPPTR